FGSGIGRKGRRQARTDGFGTTVAIGDFAGNGRPRIAVGLPGDGHRSQGSVTVLDPLTGKGRNFSQAGKTSGSPERGDKFGSALAVGDFDKDGRADLAVGVPAEAVGDKDRDFGHGVVHLFFGPALRERHNMYFRRGTRRTEFYGAALAAGDLDGDHITDLAIGVPGAGRVQVLYGRRHQPPVRTRILASPLPAQAQFALTLKIRQRTLYVAAPGANAYSGTLFTYRSTTRTPFPLDGHGLLGFALA
ncbi:FG-GAP repeat protein, partial [Actinocorallia lasiicapitis]